MYSSAKDHSFILLLIKFKSNIETSEGWARTLIEQNIGIIQL